MSTIKKKRILVPNGNYTDIPLIKEYKKLGYHVITSGNNPDLLGHKYADEYVPEDYSNKERMLALATKLNIDAISSNANDFGVITAAYVAEKLGLPGHDTYRAATVIHEKDKFKEFAKKHQLMTPQAESFHSLDQALDWIKCADFPVIIKPVDLASGKGVSRVDNIEAAQAAIHLAFSRSKSKKIVIEPFIEGTQHSIATFIVDQKVVVDYSCNEFSFINPFLVESTSAPAKDYDSVRDMLIQEIEKIASILHLADGIFHMQYIMRDGKPFIIETMRRCLGNWYLYQAGHMTDFNWEEWIAKAHLGFDLNHIPRGKKMMGYELEKYIKSEKNGKIKNITISEDIKKYIYHQYMIWESIKEVKDYQYEMLGYLFLQFDSENERDIYMHKMDDYISIEYDNRKSEDK